VKIECTRQAFQKVFNHKDFEFIGKDMSSGVPDQAMTDNETYKDASNRAMNLRNKYLDGDFWIGIEGV
jgi:non-canonical (house-cleaning) NTP pyrophosphatase